MDSRLTHALRVLVAVALANALFISAGVLWTQGQRAQVAKPTAAPAPLTDCRRCRPQGYRYA